MITYAAYGALASNPTEIRSQDQLTTLCPHLDSTKVNRLRRKILLEGKAIVALPGLFTRGAVDLVEIRCPETEKEKRTEKKLNGLIRKLNGPSVKKHDHFHEMRQKRRAQQKRGLEHYQAWLSKQESTIKVTILGSDYNYYSCKWGCIEELEHFINKGGFYPYLERNMYTERVHPKKIEKEESNCSIM